MNKYEITLMCGDRKKSYTVSCDTSDEAMLAAEMDCRNWFDELVDAGDLADIVLPIDRLYAEMLNDAIEAGINPDDLDTQGMIAAAQFVYWDARDKICDWEVKLYD